MSHLKPIVFVLMPFAPEFDEVYKSGIKLACEEAGANVSRVDDQIFTESIIERIYAQIAKADLVVADMSDRNPNVFYEVGYAHALQKKVVLLTRDVRDIPFDLKVYPHVIYDKDVGHLKSELSHRVRFLLKHGKSRQVKMEPTVSVYNAGQLVSPRRKILLDFINDWNTRRPEIVLDFHVPDIAGFSVVKQNFALITSSFITRVGDFSKNEGEPIVLPDGRYMFQSDRMKLKLMPGEWFKYNFTVMFRDHVVDRLEKFTVRIFTSFGPVDVPFTVHMIGCVPQRSSSEND